MNPRADGDSDFVAGEYRFFSCTWKKSRASHSKVKADLFQEVTHSIECESSQKAREVAPEHGVI